MTLVFYNYNKAGDYTWVGDLGGTSTRATATQVHINNPMLVHAGRMMTRVAIPLMVWQIVKDTL